MTRKAGEVHSIRLPVGAAKELHDLTGLKVSTFCRDQVLAAIQAAKLQKQKEMAQ